MAACPRTLARTPATMGVTVHVHNSTHTAPRHAHTRAVVVVQEGEVPSGSCDIECRYTPLLVDPSEDHRVDVFLDYQRATICNLRQAMQHSVHPQISIRPLHGVTHVALRTLRQAVVGDVLQKLPQLADRRQELRLKLIAAMRHGNMLVRAPWELVGTTSYERRRDRQRP